MKKTLDPRKAFILRFLLLIAVFYGLIVIPLVDRTAVEPLTRGIASATAFALQAAGQDVKAEGTLVTGGGTAVNIVNGCNGLEAIVILAAAVLAFPAPWRSRLLALGIGIAGIQILNLVRTVSLFLFLKHRPGWFDVMHTGVWQTVLVIVALGYFAYWSSRQRIGKSEERTA